VASTIVAVSGKKRHGKDVIASALVSELGFTQVAFAAQLKAAVYALDPVVTRPGGPLARAWSWLRSGGRPVRVTQVVDSLGWEAAKDRYPEVRRLLQRMGTEVGRDLFGADFWVDQALAAADRIDGPVVISDTRFVNEARAVHAHGGIVVRVNRPSVASHDTHVSETALDDFDGFDAVLVNDSTLDDLRRAALAVARLADRAGGEPLPRICTP